MANLIRGLSENGGVVFCGVDSTQIVRKAEKLHTTSATCSAGRFAFANFFPSALT